LTVNRNAAARFRRRVQEANRVSANGGKRDVLQGTLDLLVLKTLETMGPMHGWGIARRLEQVSDNLLQMNQGTLYPALLRLEQGGWITSDWGVSDNNRRARFYTLTAAGRRRLRAEGGLGSDVAVIARVLGRDLRGSASDRRACPSVAPPRW
jgi:transcriptional regulator